MLYAVLCYHDEAEVTSWTKAQDDAFLAKRAVVMQKVAATGKLGPVARLMPTSAATTVRMGREPVVIDGPFAETKEQLLGFYIIDCATLEDAIAFVRELGHGETGGFEIRPLRILLPGKPLSLGSPA
ncbi:MAG TPA: YciI family protein [Alphaproteobacteria bacterium]